MPVIVILKISRFYQPLVVLVKEREGGLLQLLLISHACDVYTAVLGTRKRSRNNTHTHTHTITAPLIDVTHEFARERMRENGKMRASLRFTLHSTWHSLNYYIRN